MPVSAEEPLEAAEIVAEVWESWAVVVLFAEPEPSAAVAASLAVFGDKWR